MGVLLASPLVHENAFVEFSFPGNVFVFFLKAVSQPSIPSINFDFL